MNNHLTQEQLIGYIHQTLTDAEREEIDQHLDHCAQCRAILGDHEAAQRYIRYGLLGDLKKVHPSNKMNFDSLAPGLKRRKGMMMFFTWFERPLSSAITLAMLVLVVASLLMTFRDVAPVPAEIVSKPTPEPVTIVFAHHPNDTEYYTGLIAKFNQIYPDIHIEQFTRQYQTKEGHFIDNSPDVVLDWQYNLRDLQRNNQLLDLTPYLPNQNATEGDDFYQHTVEAFSSQGQVWAIPISIEPMVMYYNKDLFDKYALSYPQTGWNWHDFETLANLITNPEAGIAGYVPMTMDESYLDLYIFILQNGGKFYQSTAMSKRPSFDAPLILETVEWYARVMPAYKVGYVNEPQRNSSGYGPDFFLGMFASDAGMWMGPPSLGPMYGERYWGNLRWGVAPLPRQLKPTTAGWLDGVAIAANTPHPEAAWLWVDFLSRQLPPQKVPVRNSLLKSDAYEQMVGSQMAAVTREAILYTRILSPEVDKQEEAMCSLFVGTIYKVMAGRAEPHAALQEAQQKAEALLVPEKQ